MMNTSDYTQIHGWVKKQKGKADHCDNPDCKHKSKTFEHALKKGCEYTYNLDNFFQLCKSCHNIYDGIHWPVRRGFKLTPEHIAILKEVNSKPKSEEHKKNIGISNKGKNKGKIPWMKGKKHTTDSNEKNRQKALNREKIKCPHCDKVIDKSNYGRYHGDRCKSRNKINI